MPASATTVVLSENSSHEAQVSHLDMDAVVDFQVSGSTLTLTVENKTEAGGILDVSNTFFNVSMDVTNLSLTSVTHSVESDPIPGWSLAPKDWTGEGDSNSTTQCAGFGVYNWALLFDRDHNHKRYEVGPGESIEFEIAITCATGATCDMMDFGTNLSIDPVDGDDDEPTLSLVCAKFRGLDGGDYKNLSGFGATQDPNYADDYVGEPPATEEFCGDGICNGVEDRCSCSNDCVFPGIEEYERYCSDDIDDDCNGDIDCDDFACSEDSACAVVEPPAGPTCQEVGAFCDSDADCCKNKCRGPEGRMSCKDGK